MQLKLIIRNGVLVTDEAAGRKIAELIKSL